MGGYGRDTLKEPTVKRKRRTKATGANAGGGTIERGQSRSTHARAAASATGKTGDAEWLDETERDTPDRKRIRNELTSATVRSRKTGKR
jgi:hypothetical protein